MEYKYTCPKCGKIEIFKSQATVDRKIAENAFCQNCRSKAKQLLANYTRNCPKCNKEIKYKYKSDYAKALREGSLCKSCAVKKSSIFQKGHTLNELYTTRNNSLDKLINDESLQTFYWIGFILADGSFYENRFEFGLKEDDINALNAFSEYINYLGDIKHRDSTNSNRIYFNNKPSIEKFMNKYGFRYNKTYNPCTFNTFSKFSKEQILALLIGIIDGDGHIDLNSSKAYVITITAHSCWNDFYKELLEFLNFDVNISKIDDSNIISIRLYKRKQILKLKKLIIENKLFYLKRKWDLIDENFYSKEPIIQFDLNNNIVNRFLSIEEACDKLNLKPDFIYKALTNKINTYNNYIWKYDK